MTMLHVMGAGLAPGYTIPAMVAGTAAKKGAEVLTGRNAQAARQLIAVGGNKAALKGTNSLSAAQQKQIQDMIRALLAGSIPVASSQAR